MTRSETRIFECEVRDTQSHTSDEDPNADAEFTVNTDSLHPNTMDNYDHITVYVDDTHDNTFDITVQTTAEDDTDWSAVIDEGTASGGTNSKFELQGPVGRARLSFTAAGTAPNSGRCRVTFQCLGRD